MHLHLICCLLQIWDNLYDQIRSRWPVAFMTFVDVAQVCKASITFICSKFINLILLVTLRFCINNYIIIKKNRLHKPFKTSFFILM